MEARGYAGYNVYRPGNAWFICDRCSQRFRRSAMLTEWTGLKVDAKCLDPRPPQMQPPNVFPEGQPFLDARPPQDRPDRLQDDTSLQSVSGGILAPFGRLYPDGQAEQPGALSPLQVEQSPEQLDPNVLEDDITFITGAIAAPENSADSGGSTPIAAPVNLTAPTISGDPVEGGTLFGNVGQWSGNP